MGEFLGLQDHLVEWWLIGPRPQPWRLSWTGHWGACLL